MESLDDLPPDTEVHYDSTEQEIETLMTNIDENYTVIIVEEGQNLENTNTNSECSSRDNVDAYTAIQLPCEPERSNDNEDDTESNDDNTKDKDEDAAKTRSRTRNRNPQNWRQNIRKRKRQSGLQYVNVTGESQRKREIKTDKDCNGICRFRCSHKKYHQQVESPYFIAFGHIAILRKMHFILVILTEN